MLILKIFENFESRMRTWIIVDIWETIPFNKILGRVYYKYFRQNFNIRLTQSVILIENTVIENILCRVQVYENA